MSSILRALKKLEDEKTSLEHQDLRIEREILKNNHTPARRPWYLIALAAVGLIGTASGTTYFIMKNQLPQPVLPAHDTKPSPSTPGTVKPLTDSNKIPLTAIKPQTASIRQESVPRKPVAKSVPIQGKIITESRSTTIGHSPDMRPAPLLRVNGIAMQPNQTDSLAIVNGTPVSAGSSLDGNVKVLEIKRDRVIFEHNGERFEVKLGQSNIP